MKLATTLVFVFTTFILNAQDFEVSPLKLFFNAEPGESQTKLVHVKNHNNKRETFILNINDLSIDSKGKLSYVEAGSLKNSIADWIVISPTFFELDPNEEKDISITIQQPADDNGSKWGVVMVRTAQEQTSFTVDKGISAGINISAKIAVDIYQTPSNNKAYKATISNMMEITGESDTLRTFNALINNLSDIITSCNVFLIATDVETAEEFPFPEQEFTMYPKSSRKLELYMPNTLPKGTYSLAAILDYGSKTNLEGTQIIIKVE